MMTPPDSPRNLPTILIVDDERGVRESLKMVFSKDYTVFEAESVDPAIARVTEARPDVVLLDVLLPKTDGIEVLRQIKAIHPACQVIMLTALHSKQAAAKAMDFGAFAFVGKPFDVVELRDKVQQALQNIAPDSER